jgi:hypothetical protein
MSRSSDKFQHPARLAATVDQGFLIVARNDARCAGVKAA